MKSKIACINDVYARNDKVENRAASVESRLNKAMATAAKLEEKLGKLKAKDHTSLPEYLAKLVRTHLGAKRAEVLGPFGDGTTVIDLVFDTEVRSASVQVVKSENDNEGSRLRIGTDLVAADASLDWIAERFPVNAYATAKLMNQKRAPRKAKGEQETEAEQPAAETATA